MFLTDFIYAHNIIHALYLQLLLVNCPCLCCSTHVAFQRLCARSVTVICVVVSAVSVPDLSEQFTPPETAPPALVSLIQAIEKRGISMSTVQHISLSPPHLCVYVRLSPSAICLLPSCQHLHKCRDIDIWIQSGSHTDVEVHLHVHAHCQYLLSWLFTLYRFSTLKFNMV